MYERDQSDISQWLATWLVSMNQQERSCFRNQETSTRFPALPLKCHVTVQLTSAACVLLSPPTLFLFYLSRLGLFKWAVTVIRYLNFTEATARREYDVVLRVSCKSNSLFSKVRRLQGVQNMLELDTGCKDCSSHILLPDKPELWSIPKHTNNTSCYYRLPTFLMTKTQKIQGETNGLRGWNKNGLLPTMYRSTFTLITWKCLGQQSNSQQVQSNERLDWHCFLNHAERDSPLQLTGKFKCLLYNVKCLPLHSRSFFFNLQLEVYGTLSHIIPLSCQRRGELLSLCRALRVIEINMALHSGFHIQDISKWLTK